MNTNSLPTPIHAIAQLFVVILTCMFLSAPVCAMNICTPADLHPRIICSNDFKGIPPVQLNKKKLLEQFKERQAAYIKSQPETKPASTLGLYDGKASKTVITADKQAPVKGLATTQTETAAYEQAHKKALALHEQQTLLAQTQGRSLAVRDILLMKSAKLGETSNLRLLLGNAANANTYDDYGWTPLMLAIWANSSESVRVLLAANARIDSETRQGRTALQLALEMQNPAIITLMRQRLCKSDSFSDVSEWDHVSPLLYE